MLLKGYDSTTAADIPADAQLVLGYVDGKYAWTPADWARFSASYRVGIAVLASTNAGTVLDVEQGDATPDQIDEWVKMREAAGVPAHDLLVYCSAGNQDARNAAVAAGVDLFLANWTVGGIPGQAPTTLEENCVGVQYDHPPHSGGHYDLSVWDEEYFGDSLPVHTVPLMPLLKKGAKGNVVAYLQELLASHGFPPANSLQRDGEWDGIFGTGVENAVEMFQHAENLSVDGVVGDQTWTALAEHP